MQNSENVILQLDITKENCFECIVYAHRNGPVDYEIWGVMYQCMHKATSITCKNA